MTMMNSHVSLFIKMYQVYSQPAFVQNILLWAMHIGRSKDVIIKDLIAKYENYASKYTIAIYYDRNYGGNL